MSITTNDNRRSYGGDGLNTAFAFSIPFTAASDLVALLRAPDGTQTLQVLGTDYTVSGAGNPAGGTVTFTTAPASGVTVVIYRDVPLTQPMNLQDGGPLPAATANGAFDRLTMMMQRLYERVARGITLRETDTPGAGTLDAGGNELANLADGTQTSSAVTVGQLAAVTPVLDGLAAAAQASADSAASSSATAQGAASAASGSAASASAAASSAGTSATNAGASATAAAASAAQSRISWKGQWATGTAYAVADAVQNGGSSYFCILAHTAGSTTQPGVGASWQTAWSLMAAKGTAGTGTGDMLAATYDPQGKAADAFNRTNHTGTQAISTVANLQSSLDAKAATTAVGFFSKLVETIKTADYTVTTADAGGMLVANKASAITFTLPTAASASGEAFFFRNIGAGALTLDGNGSETIEGATTLALPQGTEAMLWSNGTAWRAAVTPRAATTTEAQGGTATGVYMDPAGTKAAISILASSAPDVWVREEQASGTGGGSSVTGSATTRTLNTVKRNVLSGASLASNQVTLPAGTYFATWAAPGYKCQTHQSVLYNVTDGAEIGRGRHMYSDPTYLDMAASVGEAAFTISSAKVVQVRHQFSLATTNGLGAANSLGIEIYTELMIWKVP
ncbi:hypothetical protein [Labrys monachus]|uniref:Uncharacterized protein n=1 Tax=Labrys monachus TaxID=217067 RepID=A0ABU0FAI2_9HYPH|nr:hypothetical protein [Labrys monachus]MDQ0391124.1 hypothetical protein [Labrys monachus]